MNKTALLTAVTAAIGLAGCGDKNPSKAAEMTKCTVVDQKTGAGLIKAGMGQCNTALHSCAGQNPAGEKDAWILIPKGECDKLQMGQFHKVDKAILENIVIPIGQPSSGKR